RLLHELQPALFDELRPRGWRGIVSQSADLGVKKDLWLRAAPLQQWNMRNFKDDVYREEPLALDLREDTFGDRLGHTWRISASKEIAAAKEAAAALGASTTSESSFPRVTFLGTSSGQATRYRNVSGYLLETSSSS
ncbi:hypothetical protein PMAYCL1PPCAC_26127, partial [Pristionchus mayeri]